jgi:hypothetical protein
VTALIVVAIVAAILLICVLLLRFGLDDESFGGVLVLAVLGLVLFLSVAGIVTISIIQAVTS